MNEGNALGQYPFFTCARLHTYSDSWSFEGEALLIAGNGDVGNLSYYNGRFEAYQRTYVLMDFKDILPRFLFYVFEAGLKPMLFTQKLGNTMPYIKKGMITGFPVPLPPLDEQKRIVAVLDEAFEGLIRARSNTEANLADAQELFEAGVGSAFNAENIVSAGGSLFRLGDLAELTYGYTTKAHSEPTGPKFLRITDIQDGAVDWSCVPFCTEPPEDKERYRLVPGDIVFARTGATTGKSYLIWEEEDVVAASYLIRLRLKSPRVLSEFLAFFFQSDAYWAEIRAGISGSTQGGFNASKLGELQIPVPSIDAQSAIVERLKELKGSIVGLDTCEAEKLQLVETLRQSLLQKAFSGELT